MTRMEAWEWMDMLATMAFSSAEPMEDRLNYARWWVDLGEEVTEKESYVASFADINPTFI